jgi:DNA-binding NarL/FixJ family response regulator
MSDDVTAEKKRILIVEDHPLFRAVLGQLIEKELGMVVCGEADNVKDAMAIIEESRPDAAILDISLKGASGLQLMKDMKSRRIHLPVLVLSMHDEELYAERVLTGGGMGYISKQEGAPAILAAIRKVVAGENYLSERMSSIILERLRPEGHVVRPTGVHALSAREIEVFQMIGRGIDLPEIARRLEVGVATVATFRARIRDKLKFKNSAELYQRAAIWVTTRSR